MSHKDTKTQSIDKRMVKTNIHRFIEKTQFTVPTKSGSIFTIFSDLVPSWHKFINNTG